MFHKEGFKIIALASLPVVITIILADHFILDATIKMGIQLAILLCFLLVLQFFRNPKRITPINEQHIIAPSDGKIIEIRETSASEYFDEKKILVSIASLSFRSHSTRYPVSGTILRSEQNSKNKSDTVVISNSIFGEVAYQQVSKSFNKTIINYASIGTHVVQGEDAGFMKFGTRVDLFLPLDISLKIQMGDSVKGGEQIIASKES